MSTATEPLYPTTGEPVSVNAYRNKVGVWLCIASDVTGTIALLIAYSYLWSLNVNGAWAPVNATSGKAEPFADPVPFWLILIGTLLGTVFMWLALKAIARGEKGRMMGLATVSMLLLLITFIGQIVQLSTFPFGPADGAYASATFWLGLGAAFHLSLIMFLATAIVGRTRAGRITADNHSHVRLAAMYMTWVTVAVFLGALFATTMTTSPNTDSPTFGTFSSSSQSSAAPSPAASAAAAPSPAAS